MSITAKEIAAKLGVSATAVSMALNNRPGVSTETRRHILEAAEEYGYDFSKTNLKAPNKEIYVIVYKAYDTVLNYHWIFFEMLEGIGQECQKNNYRMNVLDLRDVNSDIEKMLQDLRILPVAGIILLGTSIPREVCIRYLSLGVPTVLVDSYFDSLDCSSVIINNRQGAYLATEYLINTRHTQPGYIRSAIRLNNFNERRTGFLAAIRDNGLSPSKSIVHEVSPSIEGAFADMLEIIENGDEIADCYFAENDLIAIGIMKALILRKINVPGRVGIIGFDNIAMCNSIQPSLTSIAIPRKFIGQTAARQLIYQIQQDCLHSVKIEISTKLIKRFSVGKLKNT